MEGPAVTFEHTNWSVSLGVGRLDILGLQMGKLETQHTVPATENSTPSDNKKELN